MPVLNLKSDLSIRNQWARQHIKTAIRQDWNALLDHSDDSSELGPIPHIPKKPELPLAPPPQSSAPHDHKAEKPRVIKIGVIGAGAAGLFTGLVLDYLNSELKNGSIPLSFEYDIHEAAGPDRVGGRLFTYNFGGQRDTHDYYDVGAMRFPDNPVMKRTFELFGRLGMEKTDQKTNPNAPDGSLIPYYMSPNEPNTNPWCYNDINIWGASYQNVQTSAGTVDPFQLNTDGGIDHKLLEIGPDEVLKANIEPLRQALKEDAEKTPPGDKGWKMLMEYDTYSTRQFLGTANPNVKLPKDIPPPPYNYETIEWLETFNGGTDWYDQSHSETVLESLDFDFSPETKWFCVLGGAQQLAKKMEERIASKPRYRNPVAAISALGKMNVRLDIEAGNRSEERYYNAVVATTTLGCLGRMDTRQAGLRYPVKQAIRSLGYGQSCKVAIKFTHAWWIHDLKDFNIRQAGLGHSDLALRTCVYPSYNIYDPKTKTAVLLCSYTWQQDSDRLGCLMSTNKDHEQKVADEQALKELLLRDLAILHRNPEMGENELYRLISKSYVDHHAYSWTEDPNTAGAFAFFRPQQFSSMWNRVIQPSGDVIIAGEASSPHHAWVVGALESVVHGLHSWMGTNITLVPELKHARDILEKDQPGNPFVGLPPYMDVNISNWHAVLGVVNRDKHLEKIGGSDNSNLLSTVLAHFDFEVLKKDIAA
ncbi:amino-acid oxidase [Fusarium pseudoanthophilum]|uniref:Amino-acid oxidase n=1 Tax=Fusarium pseudoanthophilum TaxID=48495 RepID=A0A8H5LDP9_9HYPO|nr:amino-acid oxidase [Fusarium pseudoanthophilum]